MVVAKIICTTMYYLEGSCLWSHGGYKYNAAFNGSPRGAGAMVAGSKDGGSSNWGHSIYRRILAWEKTLRRLFFIMKILKGRFPMNNVHRHGKSLVFYSLQLKNCSEGGKSCSQWGRKKNALVR